MSNEFYDTLDKINQVDQAIFESEQDVLNGNEPKDAISVFESLEKKYFV
ncbi:MAG: hypothetical protein LUG60_04195 [Erysipelotrichaceae bacterium]|nr:hypothetical protein [Erysipelotrichaceae bacterium]